MTAKLIAAPIQSAQPPTIGKQLEAQRRYFSTGVTRDVAFRIAQLDALEAAVKAHEDEIFQALRADLGKNETETYLTEMAVMLEELVHTKKHIKKWAAPRKVSTPLTLQPAKSHIIPEPKGVILIIAPWNYPFQLAMGPLVGAISAGNTAVIKPSEYAPQTSALIAKLVKKTFDPAYVTVVEGGIEASSALLDEAFDHIIFTGGSSVGRVVMEKAAKHLTPVTLELGGKSPAFVTANANIDFAAKRIAWAKCVNAGQTCIAPDYVLADKAIVLELTEKIKQYITEVYGQNPKVSPDYARIINQRHAKRLESYLKDGTVVFGGEVSIEERYFAPTIVHNPKADSPLMNEEIFGPILPIIGVASFEEGLKITRTKDRPLALYVFSDDKREVDQILSRQISGGVSVNDCMMHLANSNLPFGGVGASGYGAYHGQRGFDEFSHLRGVFQRRFHMRNAMLEAPYSGKLPKLKTLVKFLRAIGA